MNVSPFKTPFFKTPMYKAPLHIVAVMLLLTGLLASSVIMAAADSVQVDSTSVESTPLERVDSKNTDAANKTDATDVKKTSSVSTVMADNNVTGNLLQTTLGLLTVLALIAAVAWAFKRFGGLRAGAHGQLKIVGGLSLGTRERVVLLQVGEQQLVLGVSPGQIRTLHVLDKPLPGTDGTVASPTNKTSDADESPVSFAGRLQTALKQNTQNAFNKGRESN